MGCFLGCFGGAKDQKSRNHRSKRVSPQAQRNRVQNVVQEDIASGEQTVEETPITNLISEFRSKFEVKEELSPSPRKRVTFNSQVTAHEHVSIQGSVDSLPDDINTNVEKETTEDEDIKRASQSHSLSVDNESVTSSVRSCPSNHRYYNSRDSDDEADEYGDSDLDDEDDEYEYDDIDVRISGQEVWSESVITTSLESRTGNPSRNASSEEMVKSPMMMEAHLPYEEVKSLDSKTNARDRSDYINSVLNPVENISQWKTVKSRVAHQLKTRKENLSANIDPPRISFNSEPTFKKTPSSFESKSFDQLNSASGGLDVDASLLTWLVSPEITHS